MCATPFCNISRDHCAIPHKRQVANSFALLSLQASRNMKILSIAAGPLRVLKAAKQGGSKRGASRSGLVLFFDYFSDFPDFPGFSRFVWGFSRFFLFLSLNSRLLKAPTRNSPKRGPRHNPDLSPKKWETPLLGNPLVYLLPRIRRDIAPLANGVGLHLLNQGFGRVCSWEKKEEAGRHGTAPQSQRCFAWRPEDSEKNDKRGLLEKGSFRKKVWRV